MGVDPRLSITMSYDNHGVLEASQSVKEDTSGDTSRSTPVLVPSLMDGTHSVLKHRLKGAQGSFPYGHLN